MAIGNHLICWYAVVCIGIGCKESQSSQPDDNYGQFPEIAQLSQLITENPFDPMLYLDRARMYIHHEGYDEALNDLNKTISLDSQLIDAWHLKADVELEYFKSYNALETLEALCAQMPENVQNWLKLGEFQLYLKQFVDAHKSVDAVFRLAPQLARAHFLNGMIWLEQGDTSQAVDALKRCTQYDPYIFDAWLELGNIKYQQTEPSAKDYFQAVLEIHPTHEQALLGLANAQFQQGNLSEAKSNYNQIIKSNPRMTDAFYNKGLLYLDQDSVELAIDHFNITTQLDPTYTQGYLYRAICNELLGHWDLAKNDYENVLGLEPDNPSATDGLDRINEHY